MCGRFFRKRRSQTYDSIIELDVIELLRARFADEHDLPPSTVVSALGGALALRTRRRTQRRSPREDTNRLPNHYKPSYKPSYKPFPRNSLGRGHKPAYKPSNLVREFKLIQNEFFVDFDGLYAGL